MQKQATIQPPEITKIKGNKASCNGGGALGHPTVYLTLAKETNTVDCPYCDRQFIKEANND